MKNENEKTKELEARIVELEEHVQDVNDEVDEEVKPQIQNESDKKIAEYYTWLAN
jgi:hypothetical protein